MNRHRFRLVPATDIVPHDYAVLTAADMGEDYAAACRAMGDEPAEVARDTNLRMTDVIAWCEEMAQLCTVHDVDDVVRGRICGAPVPCREHGEVQS